MRKGTLTIIALVLGLFLEAPSVHSADWQYYNSDKNGSSLFYDRESVKDTNGIVKVYQKEIYHESTLSRVRERLGDKYSDLAEIVNLLEIDCSNRQSKVKSVIYYNSDGTIIESRDKEGLEWISIPQKSELNMLYELCCPSEWAYITSSSDDDYFMNIGRIEANDSNVTFWIKAISKTTKKESEKDKFTIKCKNGNYALRYHMKYQPDGSLSKVKSYESYLEWSRISSNTIIDLFQKLLCAEGQPRRDLKAHLNNVARK